MHYSRVNYEHKVNHAIYCDGTQGEYRMIALIKFPVIGAVVGYAINNGVVFLHVRPWP